MAERRITFHKGLLTFIDYSGIEYGFPATSGLNGVTNYRVQDSGPIPPGR